MEALAREMRGVGIPAAATQGVMDALRIWRVDELPTLEYERLGGVARAYWQAVIDLRNRHVGLHVTHMYICDGM
jgi:hypothetical protein